MANTDEELGLDSDDAFQQLLDDFLAGEFSDINEEEQKEEVVVKEVSTFEPILNEPLTKVLDARLEALKEQEKVLYVAYQGFVESINAIAAEAKINEPKFTIEPDDLQPNYKPSLGRKMAEETLLGWDIIKRAYPNGTAKISPTSSDDELLNFAEKSSDTALTMAIISYVETIIEIEGCEIGYEEKKIKNQRKKIEKQILEEHNRRIERSKRYIKAIQDKKFPVDAEKLVSNFFKTAKKDAEGAYNVLTSNPAIFAPIEFSKIKPRFFGLLKITPEDGVRVNLELAKFLKKLKA